MRGFRKFAPVLLLLVFIAGCTAELAPAYDQAVMDGLIATNKDIQALFVAIGPATSKETYPTRASAYDHIISELNAVELQIKIRPVPNPNALAEANKALTRLGVGGADIDPNFSDYPSARSVNNLIKRFSTCSPATARQVYRESAGGNKNQATIYFNSSACL